MPTSTFTPGDKKQDEHLNPGQRDYDRRFNDIAKAEEKGTFDDTTKNYDQTADASQEDANIQKLQNQESNSAPGGGWKNNVSDTSTKSGGRFKGWFKKSGPALGIGGIIGIGGLVMVGLSSPSLLIVQLKETMVGRFNTQLSSMEARTNKILYAKINNSTSGFCNSTVSIRCKFTSMSEKQVKKLADAGIEVEGSKTVTGRIKPSTLTFNERAISPSDFASEAGKDPKFRSALKQAYNPKYAGFMGKAWSNVSARFKISKKPVELNAKEDTKKARARINEISKEGTQDTGTRTRLVASDAECEGSSCISNDTADTVNTNADEIDASTKDGSAASDVRSKLSGIKGSTATNFFKITGVVDSGCQVYGALSTLSYAAKAIRAAQLVRYSMIFMNVADAIKAGVSPEPEDVELLGNILTTTAQSSDDPSVTAVGSATDSFGYKYAAYGDSSASEQSMLISNRFMAGGGFVGELSSATATALSFIPGGRANAKNVCKTLANPLVQGASIVLGVASLFIPGANVGKIAVSGAAAVTVGVVLAVLPSMLADIVAGTVTEDIIGEESGNAVTSGSGALMSDALAAQNGNGPMTKADAVAYNSSQIEVQNQYIADELRTTSPFDATNPHTFLGSIAAALIPLQSSSNPLTTMGSLFATSLGSLTPTSKALTTEEYAKTLDVCTDIDVEEAGYATDPFCNVIRGIPPKYLDRDPVEVAGALISSGDLTEEGQPIGNYADFIGKCITNETPLGYANLDSGFDVKEAKDCIVSDDNANYYLNYMDKQIDFGLDGELDSQETPVAQETGALPQGTAVELAQMIVSSGNVNDRTGQLQQIISGTRTNISPDILSVLAALSSSNKFTISSMKRDQALSVGAGDKSLHLLGRAADISGSGGVNGVSFGYNGHNATVQAFIDAAAAIMPENCSIGVPNQAYVNATKPKVKAGCYVFVDTGTAPHIHLDIRGTN